MKVLLDTSALIAGLVKQHPYFISTNPWMLAAKVAKIEKVDYLIIWNKKHFVEVCPDGIEKIKSPNEVEVPN